MLPPFVCVMKTGLLGKFDCNECGGGGKEGIIHCQIILQWFEMKGYELKVSIEISVKRNFMETI